MVPTMTGPTGIPTPQYLENRGYFSPCTRPSMSPTGPAKHASMSQIVVKPDRLSSGTKVYLHPTPS